MNLAENIYKYRTAKNWSQSDLANQLEVSRQSVSKWENNSAVPDLDRLIKMSMVFDVTIDELVFGTAAKQQEQQKNAAPYAFPPMRSIIGILLFIFGMVFFLLSMFWGDHLYFGEEFGELFSMTLVIFSLSLISTYSFSILGICAVTYFMYTFVSHTFIHEPSMSNYLFTFVSGLIIIVWFITYGMHATKGEGFKGKEDESLYTLKKENDETNVGNN